MLSTGRSCGHGLKSNDGTEMIAIGVQAGREAYSNGDVSNDYDRHSTGQAHMTARSIAMVLASIVEERM